MTTTQSSGRVFLLGLILLAMVGPAGSPPLAEAGEVLSNGTAQQRSSGHATEQVGTDVTKLRDLSDKLKAFDDVKTVILGDRSRYKTIYGSPKACAAEKDPGQKIPPYPSKLGRYSQSPVNMMIAEYFKLKQELEKKKVSGAPIPQLDEAKLKYLSILDYCAYGYPMGDDPGVCADLILNPSSLRGELPAERRKKLEMQRDQNIADKLIPCRPYELQKAKEQAAGPN